MDIRLESIPNGAVVWQYLLTNTTFDEQELELVGDMIAAAHHGSELANKIRNTPGKMDAERKSDLSVVTLADTSVQKFYQSFLPVKHVARSRGEEKVDAAQVPDAEDSELEFIFDPVDGTTNFSAGAVPGGFHDQISCSSLGLYKKGEPYIGVVRNLDRPVTYFAVAGKGAYVFDGERVIELTINKNQNVPLEEISKKPVIGVGHLEVRGLRDAIINEFKRFTKEKQIGGTTREMGSVAYELCQVAGGSYQVFAVQCNEWDYAAALLVAKESGAGTYARKANTGNGEKMDSVIAAHRDVFPGLQKIMENPQLAALRSPATAPRPPRGTAEAAK